ncbi:MAG TPA: DUF6036 family nucleotidyltransferase [Ktedonobacteraceae bacterium]|nr:DUF6036 family nucleotidyltransferase [Ktedonobacteraceae bacterium]
MNTTLNNQTALIDDEEPDRLINILRSWGIDYLMAASYTTGKADHLSPVELVKCLAQCKYPRVRDASISLFLLHPELADAIDEAYRSSPLPVSEQIAVLTLATLYLQRLWSFRLTVALGHTPCFPEQRFAHLWQSRHLPRPVCRYGQQGLEALQAIEQQRRGLPLNFIGDWQNQLDHLLLQEEAKHRYYAVPLASLAIQEDEEQECNEMSMRHMVTRADIEKFLIALGKTFRKPGRLYLAGGASLVHLGLRSGSTMDIGVVIETTDEDSMVTAIRRIVEQMQINIEFSSPGDFIPLPAQWEAHARYIGRYGSIEAFYFDFYSLALSKISRGSDRDLLDVKLLAQQKVITLEELDAAYHEVLPRMGKRPYINLNPQRFAERYALVRQELQ